MTTPKNDPDQAADTDSQNTDLPASEDASANNSVKTTPEAPKEKEGKKAANLKVNKTTPPEEEENALASSTDMTRQEIAVRVAASLLTTPRYASAIRDTAEIDLVVGRAYAVADALIAYDHQPVV